MIYKEKVHLVWVAQGYFVSQGNKECISTRRRKIIKKKKCKQKKTVIDRMKKVTFKKEENDHILMRRNGIGMYIGE